jgi:DNA-binding NarL/FixJ family response regulator
MANAKHRVMIVDDQALFRGSLRRILEREPRLAVVAEATSGHEALAQANFHRPEVALINAELPGLTGLHIAAALRRHQPNLALIFMSRHAEDDRIFEAIRIGASAFLTRSASPEDIHQTIASVLRGENLMSAVLLANPHLTRFSLSPSARDENAWADGGELAGVFSLREIEVLDCVVMGFTNREIGDALRLAEQTVKNYMNAILRKLGVPDRVAVLRHAIVAGWVNVGPRPTAMADRTERPMAAPRVRSMAATR